ncbi:MAG: SbcC/MukB-like Walker B domain-containing protein [Desulfovermiculus sp.]|nr:SbcC/MukB-like Walker B domain-containing protein [Desulfovermiculus sp.]
MKTMAQKIPEIFIPEDIVANGLLLAGYKLFPATHIALHPRMTVLSGNNAVGKTTILDAVQTILICHQQYINLNVATGQFDRTLSGQLIGRVGWAVLSVSGHEELTALGVRLHAKATTESLELSPFVLTRIPPQIDLFVDRENSVITPDFQTLKKIILHRDIQAQAQDFSSVDEYHRHIFAQGLLPVSMDRQGKKKFAALWSQVTRPKLDKLGTFLKEMLCPDPAQGVKFADVERLMRDRRKLTEQLQSLDRFRTIRKELEEKRGRVDDRRRLYLSTELGRQQARIRSCQEKVKKEKDKETRTAREMQDLEQRLEQATARKTELTKERDKYVSRQEELSRQHRHHQEYTQALEQEKTWQERVESKGSRLNELQEEVDALEAKRDENKTRAAQLGAQVAELTERLKHLQADRDRYLELKGLLDQSVNILGRKLATWIDVQQAWSEVQKDKARLDGLPELKKRCAELKQKVANHQRALDLAKSLAQDVLEGTDILHMHQQAFEDIVESWEELDYETPLAQAQASLDKLDRQIVDLEQGRPSLPAAVTREVDSGRLSLVASGYEHLDLEQAARVQSRLGPFARGVQVDESSELSGLDLGDEEFLVLAGNVDPESLNFMPAGEGNVCGQGGFYWYVPKSHIWLGARARARELQRLGGEKKELQKELDRLQNDRRMNRERIKRGRSLLGMWSALKDTACIAEHTQLKEEIAWLEKESPAIRERSRYVQSLYGRKEYFELHAAPRKCAQCEKELKAQEQDRKKLEKEIAKLEKELARVHTEMKTLRAEYSQADKELAGLSSRLQSLRNEEPMDVLEGRIDFSRAQAIQDKIAELDADLERLEKTRDNLHKESARKGDLFQRIGDEIQRLTQEEEQATGAEQEFVESWKKFYPLQEPEYRAGNYTLDHASRLRAEWEMAAEELNKSVMHIAQEYSLHMPQDSPAETQVDMILENIIPSFLELDKVEDQFQRLRQELGEIEARIKSYVQDIRQKVDQEISKLKRRLDKVNTILSGIRFGRISQVRIELTYLSQYENLKKLKGEVLSLMDFGSQTTLQEFVQELTKNIFRHGRADVSEEQIADYRTYIDLGWSITDLDGEKRQKGFSGGETLGINLAICLGLLFHWGGEAGQAQAKGLLIMALDEAERLDEQAVYTVRELLDRSGAQLMVALPRTIEVPDTVCHLLTPLEQGVTHVSVYHKG